VQVRFDAPKVKLAAVISRAIQVMEISVAEWNGMAETARFQAVEDVISKERAAETSEKAAFEALSSTEPKLKGAPEDSSTPAKPLEEMHLNKLRALGKQYGITEAATMKSDELVKALKPFIETK
jgi:Rho termination factor, N-terminal domain